jgi:hypothetical protein
MHSFNNHFRFGYNGQLFNARTSPKDKWWVSYGRSERQPLDFRTECRNTARLIREHTEQKLVVLFSGGVDSEIVMRAFRDAGIPVEAAILRYNDQLNAHDIGWAIDYCEAYAVKYSICDLDLTKFWDTEVYEYAEWSGSASPQLCTVMWYIDQIDGYPIVGSGDSFIAKRLPPGFTPDQPYPPTTWDSYDKEVLLSVQRFLMHRRRPGVPRFFKYNPEIIYAFLQCPIIVDLVNNRRPGKFSTYDAKGESYQHYFPELIARPKYTGFENIKERAAHIATELDRIRPGSSSIVKTPYHRFVDQLGYHDDMATAVPPMTIWKAHAALSAV